MGPEILLTALGFPISLLANLTYERIKKFSKKIEISPFQGLFIKTFCKSLDVHGKTFGEGVKRLKKSIKQEEAKFMEIFNGKAKDYNSFLSALKEQTFQEEVALEIVEQFEVEKNFKDVMVLIVRDCLTGYQDVFLRNISEKEGIQLILLFQGLNIDVILKSIESLKKSIKSDLIQTIEKEAEEGKATIEPKKIGKQIKILSITASPEDDLAYEREQDTLLDAFRWFDRDEVYLDIPDPVKDTLSEIETFLQDGHHDVLYLSAHGSIDEDGKGVLLFENQRGEERKVTGAQLLDVLKPAPKIVILSSCHSARKEPELMTAANTLYQGGIDIVIGMKQAISHDAAIEFNVGFFRALLRKKTVKTAFDEGKEAILTWEKQQVKKNPQRPFLGENEIPQLLAKDEKLTVDNFSQHRIEAPGRPESHHFLGAKYLERGFIGRRRVLRDIFKSIENKEGAVVLKGPGGIGKSTLTTRTAANLRRKGYEFIVVQGETTTEQILEAVSKKAALLGVKDAENVYGAKAEPNEKLAWFLDQFLLKQKVVIILDNFEENQDEAKAGEFKRERLKEFTGFFRDSLKHHDTFLMFSTRYTLPGFDSPDITINIPEFRPVEFRKMLLNRKALKRLDSQSVKTLRQEIGGNPRALELLDRIAYEEFKQREFTWQQLKDLLPEMRERIIEKKGKGDEFTPLFLERLLGYLSGDQRLLLDILAIYRNPVPVEAVTAHKVSMKREDRRKLGDLSLLECIDIEDNDLYYVHRLTAQYLVEQMKPAERKRYHKKAARYFEGIRDEERRVLLDDWIESRWHYIQAVQWNKAAEITLSLEDYLFLRGYPQWAMELLTELELPKIKEEYRAEVHLRIGRLFGEIFGEYEKALSHYRKALEINEKIDNIKGVSSSLHNIGMIYQYKGDYEAALTNFQKAKEVFEKIGDIKNVSKSLHNIGMIYQSKGDYEAALTNFKKSMEIDEKIGDIKGVATSLHQIGMIYQDRGDYEAALKEYQKSLEMKEKIGDIKGVANSLHQIGNVHYLKGDYEAALNEYQTSLEMKEKIGDIKGVANSLGQIGTVYKYKGDYEEALTNFQKAKEVFEKIGDIKGVSTILHQIGMIYQSKGDYDAALKEYQKSLEIEEKIGNIPGAALSMAQMGTLYFQQDKCETALKFFIQAFLVFAKIGSPKANQARKDIARVREKLPEEQFNAILKEFNLPPDVFDKKDAEEQQKKLNEFLIGITKEAVSASEKNSSEKEKLAAQLNQFIEQLPDAPEAEGLKNYFQLLLAAVKGEDHQEHLEKVPEELKELFERTVEEIGE